MKTPPVIHKSFVKAALRCRWAAERIYCDNIATPATEPMLLGLEGHALREALDKGEITDREAYEQASTEELYDLVQTVRRIAPWPKPPDAESETYFGLSPEGEFIPDCTPENEEAKGALFGGRRDRVVPPRPKDPWRPNTVLVDDAKFGWLHDVCAFEQDLYAYASYKEMLYRGFDVTGAHFAYIWARRMQVESRFYCHRALANEVWPRLLSWAAWLQSEPATPIPGHQCTWCQFIGNGCPVMQDAEPVNVSGDTVPDGVDAVAVFRTFLDTGDVAPELAPIVGKALSIRSQQVKRLKAHMKTWILNHHPIQVGTSRWEIREEDGDGWHHEMAQSIMQAHEVPKEDQERVLRVTKRSVETLRTTHPAVYEALYEAARVKKHPVQRLVAVEAPNESVS